MSSAGAPPSFGRPPLPRRILAAGVIWITFGALILVTFMAEVLVYGLTSTATGGSQEEALGMFGCLGAFLGLFASAFIYVGVQSVAGTARDTLGNGIGSIVFGLVAFAGVVGQIFFGQFVHALLSFQGGCGLLVAGVLALLGRQDYRTWLSAK